MSAYLALCYSVHLTTEEKLLIDNKISEDWNSFFIVLKNVKKKTSKNIKKTSSLLVLSFFLSQPIRPVFAMGCGVASINRINMQTELPIKINQNSLILTKINRIEFKKAEVNLLDKFHEINNEIFRNPEIYNLRGGDLDLIEFLNLVICTVGLYVIISQIPVSDAFMATIKDLAHQYNTGTTLPKPYLGHFSKYDYHIREPYAINQLYKGVQDETNPHTVAIKAAYKKASDVFGGRYLEVDETNRISDLQACKKLYHCSDFGIDPATFGQTQENLNLLNQRNGIYHYLETNPELPPRELVETYQIKIKETCLEDGTIKYPHATFTDGRGRRPATVFGNRQRLLIIVFQDGLLVTCYKKTVSGYNNFVETQNIGITH